MLILQYEHQEVVGELQEKREPDADDQWEADAQRGCRMYVEKLKQT